LNALFGSENDLPAWCQVMRRPWLRKMVKIEGKTAPSCTRDSNFRLLNLEDHVGSIRLTINYNLGCKIADVADVADVAAVLMGRCCCVCHRSDNSNWQHGLSAFFRTAREYQTMPHLLPPSLIIPVAIC